MQNQYRPDIDGLRAISVLFVIFYHANIFNLSGGYVGVDVFFVISGYLITKILINELNETGSISFLRFFTRRIRRLFPALAFVILLSLSIWLFFFTGITNDTSKFVRSIPFALFGLANFFFQNNTGSYFSGANDEMPLLHFWSLAVEEQFYLIYPLLLIAITRNAKDFKNNIKIFHYGIFITSLSASYILLKMDFKNEAFYLMPPRMWEFSLGALILFVPENFLKSTGNKRPYLLDIFAIIGLLSIAIPAFHYTTLTKYPGLNALAPTLGASLILLNVQVNNSKNGFYAILSNKYLVWIGTISYSLYLWHQPLLAFTKIYSLGISPPTHLKLSAIALSFIMAYLSYKYIESPFRYSSNPKKSSNKKVYLAVTITTLSVILFSKYVVLQEQLDIEKNNLGEFYSAIEARTELYPRCVDKLEKWKMENG